MKPTLAQRAAKIREDFENVPSDAVKENKQFFDDVWSFCGAVIEASESGGGQFSPGDPIM